MKKPLLALALAASCATAHAQAPATPATAPAAPTASPATPDPAAAPAPAGYTELLGETIEAIMRTGDPAELSELAASMERAAAANATDWLPRYYQAYALLINVFQSKDSGDAKDKTLDRAEAAIAQARQLKGDESELLTLQAYLAQARLGVAPTTRWMKCGAQVREAVSLAEALNPANPRPYLVAANQVYYTPAMFGGGADKAKPLYEQAKAKFEAFRPAGPLLPNWGQRQLLGRLKAYDTPTATTATRGN